MTLKHLPFSAITHRKYILETLVHSSLRQELSSPCGTFPCGVGQCKTCKFKDSSTTISAPKFVYHIKHHFTCTSFHLIYCISCSRCGILYIGKTRRYLRTSFGEHRCAFTSNDANQPVSRHFNNGSHCVSDLTIRALCPISGSNAGADPAIKSDRSIVAEGHRRGRRPRAVGGSGGILPRKIFEI